MCRKQKVCVGVPVSQSIGPHLHASLSLSVSPFIRPALSTPVWSLLVSASICSNSSSTVTFTTPGEKCTDTTDQIGSASPSSPSPPSPSPYPPCLFSGLFFRGANGFWIAASLTVRLWIIVPPHRRKGRFCGMRGCVCDLDSLRGRFRVCFCAAHAATSWKRRGEKKHSTQMCCEQNPQFSHSADLGQFSAWHGVSGWVNPPPPHPVTAHPLPHPQWVWKGGWQIYSRLWTRGSHSVLHPLISLFTNRQHIIHPLFLCFFSLLFLSRVM